MVFIEELKRVIKEGGIVEIRNLANHYIDITSDIRGLIVELETIKKMNSDLNYEIRNKECEEKFIEINEKTSIKSEKKISEEVLREANKIRIDMQLEDIINKL